jgi:hypothetical protein
MPSPNISVTVEPSETGKLVYQMLAAQTKNHENSARLMLQVSFKNNESKTVKIKNATVSYTLSQGSGSSSYSIDMTLAPGASSLWWFAKPENDIILPTPAPSTIKLSISCDDFDTPKNVWLSLSPHKSPTPAGNYLFPARTGDLRSKEYWAAEGDVHAAGNAGSQLFAYDMGVVGYDSTKKSWSDLLPGTKGTENDDFRIWGKPVHAMADGTVLHFENDVPNNPKPLSWKDEEDLKKKLKEQKDNYWGTFDFGGAGNHFYIQHGDEVILYAHMQKGSLSKDLLKNNATVRAGEFLGLAGNSGNSTAPHLHIHAVQGTKPEEGPLRPMIFRNAFVCERSAVTSPPKGPWVRMNSSAVPAVPSVVWPGSTYPGYPVPAVGISMGGDWANAYWISPDLASFKVKAQDLFDKKGYRLVHETTFVENGKRRWVGISRSGDWANRWWVSSSFTSFNKTAQDLFDKKGLRLVHIHTYVENGQRKWVGISMSGNWANRLYVKSDLSAFKQESQKLFDEKGLRLVHVTTFVEGGKRKWVGISRSGDWANRWWISPDFDSFRAKSQELFDKEGKRLAHVTSYVEGGKRKWLGISRSGDWANRFYLRKDLDSFNFEAQRLFDENGLRLVHVEMLE